MDPIKIPKPPAKALNPNRPASDLLQQQVRHLEWAVRHAGERRTTWGKVKNVKTEADAALRTQQLLPKLPSAKNLPFSKASLEEAAVLKKAKYSVPEKTAKKSARKKTTGRKSPKKRGTPSRPRKTKSAKARR